MPNYSKGQIYSIRFHDNDKLIYIGSSIQPLGVRFGGHKRDIKCSLFQYIQENYNGDFKCCYIELLEPYECNNRNELNKREGEVIRKYKADNDHIVINKQIAGRTRKEYKQDNLDKIKEQKKKNYQENVDKIKEKIKSYYQDNADKIKERNTQYYKENKEKIKERDREYQQKNAEKIKQRKKQYYQKNTEKIKDQAKQYYQKKKTETEAND